MLRGKTGKWENIEFSFRVHWKVETSANVSSYVEKIELEAELINVLEKSLTVALRN